MWLRRRWWNGRDERRIVHPKKHIEGSIVVIVGRFEHGVARYDDNSKSSAIYERMGGESGTDMTVSSKSGKMALRDAMRGSAPSVSCI